MNYIKTSYVKISAVKLPEINCLNLFFKLPQLPARRYFCLPISCDFLNFIAQEQLDFDRSREKTCWKRLARKDLLEVLFMKNRKNIELLALF